MAHQRELNHWNPSISNQNSLSKGHPYIDSTPKSGPMGPSRKPRSQLRQSWGSGRPPVIKTMVVFIYGCGSKPCTPGERANGCSSTPKWSHRFCPMAISTVVYLRIGRGQGTQRKSHPRIFEPGQLSHLENKTRPPRSSSREVRIRVPFFSVVCF